MPRTHGRVPPLWGDDAAARALSARAVRLRSVAYPFLCLRVGGRRGSPTGAVGALGGAVDAGADGRGACAAFEVEPRPAKAINFFSLNSGLISILNFKICLK